MAAVRIPLVVVLGATGAGKSKLAIEIAKALKGEIISADSMQIYKGLDIISNKVTEEEQAEAPHHLISYLEPERKHYNVVDFRDAALPIIDDLLSRSIVPVVVGGTNYYIESILWDFLINKRVSQKCDLPKPSLSKDWMSTPNASNRRKCDPHTGEMSGYLMPGHQSSDNTPLKTFKKPKMDLDNDNTNGGKAFGLSSSVPATMKFTALPLRPSSSPSSSSPSSSSSSSSSLSSLSSSSSLSLSSSSSPSSSLPFSSATKKDMSTLHESSESVGLSNSSDQRFRPVRPSAAPEKEASGNNQRNNSSGLHQSGVSMDISSTPTPLRPQHTSTPPVSNNGLLISHTTNVSCRLTHDSLLSAEHTEPAQNGYSSQEMEYFKDEPGAIHPTEPDLMSVQTPILAQLKNLSAAELYARLQEVDPETAAKQHPNNTRKVLRALEVYYETGRKMSSLLDEQHEGRDGAKSGPLRYPDPCILWVQCRQPELDRRLDGRVDTMIEKGLLAELEDFYLKAQKLQQDQEASRSDDKGYVYPHGILQMLGFKEFNDYLSLEPHLRTSEHGQNVFNKGVDELKQATRRYAKQQVRWINNRFCARPGENVPLVYAVDSTDLSVWDQAVAQALQVVSAYTKGEQPSQAPEPAQRKVDSSLVREVCDVCGGRVFLHMHEWTGHLKSKKHRHNVKLAKARGQLSGILTARETQLEGQGHEIGSGNILCSSQAASYDDKASGVDNVVTLGNEQQKDSHSSSS